MSTLSPKTLKTMTAFDLERYFLKVSKSAEEFDKFAKQYNIYPEDNEEPLEILYKEYDEAMNSDDEKRIEEFQNALLDKQDEEMYGIKKSAKKSKKDLIIKEHMDYYHSKDRKRKFNDLSVSGKEWRARRNGSVFRKRN